MVQTVFATELVRREFRTSVCNVTAMTIDFTIDQAFGEPLVRSRMKWEAGPNTSKTCINTQSAFYITIENADGTFGYIRINPSVVAAGEGFGISSSSSPSWHELICSSARSNASCLSRFEAQAALGAGLIYDSFEVITDASVVVMTGATPAKTPSPKTRVESKESETLSAFDRLLKDMHVDTNPATGAADDESQSDLVQAGNAAKAIMSLVSEPLSRYRTPAHQCESPRQFSNWVSVKSACEISFRRESEHEFLCAEGGESRQIHATSSVDLDFSRHIAAIEPLKRSPEGWVALVLRLNNRIVKGPADARLDRWQFTAGQGTESEMTLLAENLRLLKEFCETNT